MAVIPLIGFAPDLEQTTPGAMRECSNIVPTLNGFAAVASNVATLFPASAEAVTGSALVQKLDGSYRFFIGGASKLQEGVSSSWTDQSKVGGYSAGTNRWRFCQFGNDTLAANKSVALQRSTGSAFASLTAPKADLCETTQGFVFLANVDDTGAGLGTAYGDSPDRWWCSAINDVATWTPSAATQCTTGRLVDAPGPIKALRRLGQNVIAYKEKSIFVGSYVGGAPVWQFSLVPGEIGTPCHEAVVNIGFAHLFVGETDIYRFDGTRPEPLGAPMREWFFSRLNRAYQYNIAAVHDRPNSLVYWFYPSTNSASGVLDEAIVYNYRTNHWGAIERSIEMPVELVQGGITYDNLGSLYNTYDDLPAIAYDSPFWTSATPVPALISTDHRPYTMSGEAGSWAFATHLYGDEQIVSLVDRVNVRWISKPATASLTARYGMDEGATLAAIPPTVMSSSGRFDVLRSARWHQFAISGSGDMEVMGLEVRLQQDGLE